MNEANMITHKARFWLRNAIFQGERFLNLFNSPNKSATVNECVRRNEILQMEAHFFIMSICSAGRWLKKLNKFDEYELPADKIQDAYFKSIKHIRDIREHYDEYFPSPSTNKAKDKSREYPDTVSSAPWICSEYGELKIGELKVEEMMDKLHNLLERL